MQQKSLSSDTLSAVVVWYNPSFEEVENVLKYNSQCKKIYIIDNSTSDNSELASKIDNAEYIPLFDNCGLGKALNVGCEKALSDGFEWCMTMDQDSKWNPEMLESYFLEIGKMISDKNISFSPSIVSFSSKSEHLKVRLRKSARKFLTRFFGENAYKKAKEAIDGERPELKQTLKIITSGNIINLGAWEKIGKFNELLFIEQVDYDFCYRLKDAGYNLIKIRSISMDQNLGDGKQHFFEFSKYHGVRLYYRYRNWHYVHKMYPHYVKGERQQIFATIKEVFFRIITFKFRDVYFIMKGISDFKKGKFGRFDKT